LPLIKVTENLDTMVIPIYK